MVNVTYENDENETELMKQGRNIVPLPDSHSRSADEDNNEEEIEVTLDSTSKKYFVAKIKEEGEEKGLKPVSQTQPSTSATGRPTQEKCVTSSREESARRTPPKDIPGK